MAQQTYDPDSDERFAPGHLKEAEQAAAQDSHDQAFNNNGESPGSSLNNQETAAASDGTASSAAEDTGKTEASSADDTVGEKGYTGGGKKKGIRAKVKGLSNAKKYLLLGSSTGGLGIVAIILLLVLLASSLKLPNLEENIVGFQFARIGQEFAHSGELVTDESLSQQFARALQNTPAGKAIVDRANALHDRVTGFRDGTIATVQNIPGVKQYLKLNDKFNPAQVERNLNGQGISFGETPKGLKTVTLTGEAAERLGYGDGVTFIAEAPTGAGRFIPGFDQFLKNKSNNNLLSTSDVQSAVKNAFETSERLQDVPPFIRGVAFNRILGRLKISRAGFKAADFKNADNTNKELAAANKEANSEIAPEESAVPGEGTPVSEAAEAAAGEEEQAIQAAQADPTGRLAAALSADGTGEADAAVTTLQKSLTQSLIEKGTQILSGPVYQFAYLACVFDEGATGNTNNQTIDATNDSNEKSFVLLASVSDQQKNGPTDNSQVTGFDNGLAGYNTKYGGDVTGSIPLLRQSGASYDTSGEPAAQSTVFGYQPPKTVITSTTGGSVLWSFMHTIEPGCKVINNPVTLVTDIGINVLSTPVDGEEEAAGNGVLDTIIGRTTGRLTKTISENFGKDLGAKAIGKNFVTKSYKLMKDFIKNGAIVFSIESLGALMASSHAPGVTNNGYETGNTAINQADAGGNAVAQEQDRTMMFGRPLTEAEACATQSNAMAYVKANFQKQSVYQRYLATSNYQSLTSRMAMTVGSDFSGPNFIGRSFTSLATVITQPQGLFRSFANAFGGKTFADATQNCSNASANYGNVQFGWSADEEALIDSDPSYKPDENLAVLADNGARVQQLAQDYAYCFGYKVDPSDPDNLVFDPTATVGRLETDNDDTPSITRDADGDVIANEGNCSPDNLSYDSPVADAQDTSPDTNKSNDLIFRWRLANRYEQTQEQLTQEENVTTTDDSGGSSTPSDGNITTPTGTVETLAKQVLANPNISFQNDNGAKQDVQAAANGQKITPGPFSDGSSGLPACKARTPVYMNAAILQVALNLAQKYKYQINDMISGHACDTGQHPLGRAMDLFYIAGQPLNDSWWASSANVATANDFASIVNNTGSYQHGFGVGCSAVSKIQSRSNLVVFLDSCKPQDEIHIDVRGAP